MLCLLCDRGHVLVDLSKKSRYHQHTCHLRASEKRRWTAAHGSAAAATSRLPTSMSPMLTPSMHFGANCAPCNPVVRPGSCLLRRPPDYQCAHVESPPVSAHV